MIELNIFTNTIPSAPDIKLIERVYNSFLLNFDGGGEIPVTVYCDSHPREEAAVKYIRNLRSLFENVFLTDSLSDGYVTSIKRAKADFLFQLEGDWIFNHNIKHSLLEIIEIMQDEGIYHFRFNKRHNSPAVWDTYMVPVDANGFRYCKSNNLSNNPHIIDVKRYRQEILNFIEILPGSKGIEEKLNKVGSLESCVYGDIDYPPTILHLDGRAEC
jgi:hypothetical protein